MITFDDARQLDSWAYDLVLGDAPRAEDRTLINRLANGGAPYSQKEQEENNIRVNVNPLTLPRVLHDARAQYLNAFMQQGNYFTCKTDFGPMHKRDIYSAIVQREINKVLKGSIKYFESMRSGFASLVLHGIAPVLWENQESPLPKALGIEDPLIPSDTLLDLENLPFFMVRRSFTSNELKTATRRSKRDPGWNLDFVDRLIEWADSEMTQLIGESWPQQWAPEKWEEMDKQGGGLSWCDRAPTVDCFDVYGFVEATAKEPAGWVRRIILDSWSQPGLSGGVWTMERQKRKDRDGKSIDKPNKKDFLFSSERHPVGESWQNIIGFQYADLSAVAPFRYHSVRSLGWMLYAVCHLEARMIGKFEEAVFEALMQYFKVTSADDVQNALRLELFNLGFIDDTLKPVPAAERWQCNANLVELGLTGIQNRIDQNSKSWTQDLGSLNNKTEKTKFEVMAKIQSANALVSAGINQAYAYKVFEYREIVRRFMNPKSRDPMVRAFREACLRQGVPQELLGDYTWWDVQSEKVMGGGNQTLEMLTAQGLMQIRGQLDPQSQRIVDRKYISSLTHDPALTIELVPEKPDKVTTAAQEASRVLTSMLSGVPAEMLPGTNPIEYTESALKLLDAKVQQGNQTPQKMVAPDKLQGLEAFGQDIGKHIQQLSQDKAEKQRVAQYSKILGKLMNELRAFGQRLKAAMKKQQMAAAKNGGGNGEAAAKIAAPVIMAQTKAKIKEAEARQKLQHKNQQFHQDLKHNAIRTGAEIAKQDLTTAAQIRRGGMKSFNEEE